MRWISVITECLWAKWVYWFGMLFAVPVSVAAATLTEQTYAYWLDNVFHASSLSRAEQQAELAWFTQAAKPYKGLTIRVVSEDISTHHFEANQLARAFYDITGIRVIHEITREDDLVRKLELQMETGLPLYDAFINDTDFIGTHALFEQAVPISTYIETQWKPITLPTLALDDFIGLAFGKARDGVLYQLPDQQFANLYWYRHDWFSRPDLQQAFKAIYGYELGVPKNWAAYEDIAEFFSEKIQYIDGLRVWGHMDYGQYDPSLGWRISDGWLGLAGMADKGLPNGLPVNDWGIRTQGCVQVGASMRRGGALDSPAAIYAVEKYVEWLNRFAPPDARTLNFSSFSGYALKGNVAQQIFWYSAFVPAFSQPSPLVDDKGMPRWRVAPSPVGKYWKKGMKSGYQDVGAWTFLRHVEPTRLAAAWLYAQFTVSKTVSMSKLIHGATPIRYSDLSHPDIQALSSRWGGLMQFYLSEARNHWTPTGQTVPDYSALSSAWWQELGPVVAGDKSVREGMKSLANEMDKRLALIGEAHRSECKPALGELDTSEYWLNRQGAPWPEIKVRPKGQTMTHKQAMSQWH